MTTNVKQGDVTVRLPASRTKVLLRRVGVGVVLVAVWQLVSVLVGVSPSGVLLVPGPVEVAKASLAFAGYWIGGLGAPAGASADQRTVWGAILGLVYNAGVSLLRALVGLALGVIAGVGLGLLVSLSSVARNILIVPAQFARMMPLLAMLPLFGLWFGRSELGSILFIAFAVAVLLFVVTLNAIQGVPGAYRMYAASLGANRLETYRSVIVPAALPELKAGLLLAIPFAWSAVLAAEMLGKEYGLGRIVQYALLYAATDMVAAAGLAVIALAVASYFLAKRGLDHLTRWA
jgi:sulfonate transport system permease protein